ncbi:hypothetical protein QTP70_011225 [Hemibagrus guttatus]|uniref:Reverse transcriptase domain-containing protein n=1 Tax=Hemibagrus guttatus TaxID=175788 RepID=A0AAE0V0C6_9TELE|nr:hypothetical protein QTP70_011225 [Hemibagrus guttatus]
MSGGGEGVCGGSEGEQVILSTPCDQVLHLCPVGCLIVVSDEADDRGVSWTVWIRTSKANIFSVRELTSVHPAAITLDKLKIRNRKFLVVPPTSGTQAEAMLLLGFSHTPNGITPLFFCSHEEEVSLNDQVRMCVFVRCVCETVRSSPGHGFRSPHRCFVWFRSGLWLIHHTALLLVKFLCGCGARHEAHEDPAATLTGPLAANRSTDNAMATTLHLALTHLDNKDSYVRMLFIDFSSAFNTIIPQHLIENLSLLDLNTSLCNWILDILTGRPQSVQIRNSTSNTTTLNTGAPQGCVLSPLLFTQLTHNGC